MKILTSPDMPPSLPADSIRPMLDSLSGGNDQKAMADLHAVIDSKLADGELSQAEMIETISELGNRRFGSIKPPAAIQDQAADIVKQQNMQDPDGQIAAGLARAAIGAGMKMQGPQDDAAPAPKPLPAAPAGPGMYMS